VTARGRYLSRYQILIDNRVQDGRIGYHVLTPLLIDGGDTVVLVNRGWVAQGADRQQLPGAEPPAGPQTIEGVATLPSRPGIVMFRAVAGEGWQTLWQYPDLDHYRKLVPHAVQPVVVLLDPAPEYGPLSRQWVRLDAGIATNQGYALTWFSLAVALLAIYLVVNLHKINVKDHEDRLE
jgi:surfeit locus 1 family protein